MAFSPINDQYGQAVLHWSIAGGTKPYTSTHGFGNGTLPDATDSADTIFDTFTQSGCPGDAASMYIGWTFLGVSVTVRDGSTFPTGDHFEAVVGTGVTGSPAVPLIDPFNPIVVSKKTAFGGRQYRGRMYAPPTLLTTAQVDPNGIISSGQLAVLQSVWDLYFDELASAPLVRMALNHPAGGATPATEVTSLIVRNVLGSQRRRKARSS